MSDRECGPSIGDWDDAAGGGEGDDDGSEAGLAGLGTPLANSRIRDQGNFETRTASVRQPDPGGADDGSAGGMGSGLGATRDSGAGSTGSA
jgi:hypothetical protein